MLKELGREKKNLFFPCLSFFSFRCPESYSLVVESCTNTPSVQCIDVVSCLLRLPSRGLFGTLVQQTGTNKRNSCFTARGTFGILASVQL